jgi:hypothetical protein
VSDANPDSREYLSSHASNPALTAYGYSVEGIPDVGLPSPHDTQDVIAGEFCENVNLSIRDDIHPIGPEPSFTYDSGALVDFDLFNSMSEEANMHSSLSWIFNDVPDIVFGSIPNSPSLLPTPVAVNRSGEEPPPPQATRSDPPGFHDDQSSDLPMLDPQDIMRSEETFSIDWQFTPTQHLILPYLGGSDESLPPASYFEAASITTDTRIKLLDSIQIPLEHGPWQPISMANFPSCRKLAHCIDLYFAHFNKVCFSIGSICTV